MAFSLRGLENEASRSGELCRGTNERDGELEGGGPVKMTGGYFFF